MTNCLYRNLVIVATALLPGCVAEPEWVLQRQVVDESGNALTNVQVDVSARRNLHSIDVQVSGNTEAASNVTIGTNGFITVRSRSATLFLTIRKVGYIPKTFMFHPAQISPREAAFPERIQLLGEQVEHPSDELDRLGHQRRLLDCSSGQRVFGIRFPEGEIVDASDLGASLLIEFQQGAFKVTAVRGAELAPADWETRLTANSWMENHMVAPTSGFTNEFTAAYARTIRMWGFFVKALDNAGQEFYVRAFLDAHNAGGLFQFDTSRDTHFAYPK